jgi:hypothetical protein
MYPAGCFPQRVRGGFCPVPPAAHASSSQGQPKAHCWRVEVPQDIGNSPCLCAALVLEILNDRVDGGRRSSSWVLLRTEWSSSVRYASEDKGSKRINEVRCNTGVVVVVVLVLVRSLTVEQRSTDVHEREQLKSRICSAGHGNCRQKATVVCMNEKR